MKKEVSPIIPIILIILLMICFILSIPLVFFGVIVTPITQEAISSGAEASKGGVVLEENISTSNPETIAKSSQANNFIKYCIGIVGLIFAISCFGGVIYLFYKEHNKHKIKR